MNEWMNEWMNTNMYTIIKVLLTSTSSRNCRKTFCSATAWKPQTGDVNIDYIVTMAPVEGWDILCSDQLVLEFACVGRWLGKNFSVTSLPIPGIQWLIPTVPKDNLRTGARVMGILPCNIGPCIHVDITLTQSTYLPRPPLHGKVLSWWQWPLPAE